MPPKKVKDENTITKDLIKKLMKDILNEDNTLSLDKKITSRVKDVNKKINDTQKCSKRELLIQYFEMVLCEILDFEPETNLIGMKENYDEVEKFIKEQKKFPDLEHTYFGTTDHVVYKNYLDDYKQLVKIILDAKQQIINVIGEKEDNNVGLDIDSDEDDEDDED
jgi:hypothetical protein